MREQASEPYAGLRSDDAPVPLLGVSIEAKLHDLAARVTVSQRYANHEAKPIEAVYVFPLDEAAAVCAFEAVIDGVRVVGRAKEREEGPGRLSLWSKRQPDAAAPPAQQRPLDALVLLQRAEGSWDLSEDLARILERPLPGLSSRTAGASGDAALARRALATALALRWLALRAGAERSEWTLLARKAERWLDACGCLPARGTWQEVAAELLA